MNTQKLVLLAAVGVGVGALLLMQHKARQAAAAASPTVYRVPGVNARGAPAYPTAMTPAAASEAAAYQGLGSMIGGIYSRVFGAIGSSSGSSSGPGVMSPMPPDDGIAANPPAQFDPYAYESQAWDSFFP